MPVSKPLLLERQTVVRVRRQWNSRKIGEVRWADLEDLHWDRTSGGLQHRSPFVMMYGYMWCDRLASGRVAHSCIHGEGPHRIKVVVVKKDNPRPLVAALIATLPPQHPRRPRRNRRGLRPPEAPGPAPASA
jgi:hypothetical protein